MAVAGASGSGGPLRTKKSMWGEASEVQDLSLEQLLDNPFNPRKTYDEAKLRALADTILAERDAGADHGVLQAIVTAPAVDFFAHWEEKVAGRTAQAEKLAKAKEAAGDLTHKVVIIIGHRRKRALEMISADEFAPCVVDSTRIERARIIGLNENGQRVDLNPMEEADGYQDLLDDGLPDQEAVARQVGKTQAHVSRRLGLLKLPLTVQEAIAADQLSAADATLLRTQLTDKQDKAASEKAILDAWTMMKENEVKAGAAITAIKARRQDPVPKDGKGVAGDKPSTVPGPRPGPRTTKGKTTGHSGKGTSVPPDDAEQAESGSGSQQDGSPNESTLAAAARDRVCAAIVETATFDNARQTVRLLAPALLAGTDLTVAQERAHHWLRLPGSAVGPDIVDPRAYLMAVLTGTDASLATRVAFAIALAVAELRASDETRTWDARDRAHLDYLRENGHTPSDWEEQQLRSELVDSV
ncbi:ParB/RepB/Spo0J family partition protein [Kitasatospora sp. NPDC127060]|uniref:ParB/RepB/Spo0J family partition protein n=1 Tax=Kitasatospora sp. NPDC127060 TaxID=3347121 RepID=UPI003660657D